MNILVLNSGSSSQKSALFELDEKLSQEPVPPLWEGKLDWDGNHETLTLRNSQGKKLLAQAEVAGEHHPQSVEKMLAGIWRGECAVLDSPEEIHAIGHRVVHGGAKLTEPTVIDLNVKRAIAELSDIAPLHNRAALQEIELIERVLPGVPQVAVFDTGFHRTLPLAAKVYAGPYEWYEHGIQRFGFHGINHQYCAYRTAEILGRELSSLKIVSCHLGNGCSLAAIDGGKSVDTTMGFTPLEGLMMGTRSGSIDPGILVYLMRSENAGLYDIDDVMNRHSGLLGISGVSSDMRDVQDAMRRGNERARLAFDIFVHRLVAEVGAMSTSLGGLDVLVFTAGIGENSADVRRAACDKLRFLGIQIDEEKNAAAKADCDISASRSGIRVLVIRAQEDWAIAQECVRLVSAPVPAQADWRPTA